MVKLIDWREIIAELELTAHHHNALALPPVYGAYCGDMMSDVLARARRGSLWITIQRHRNVIAVASLVGLSGVVISGGRVPPPDTVALAEKEGVPLFSTPLDSFHAAGRLYYLLTRVGLINPGENSIADPQK
ncbi:hypothetical protein J2Z49_002331 [Desulfofundulus luciae]|uniref:DRTGG domain-containing protein n=1 Tax=Desulfofundulus luciae TaxID=74702 RepID=A0ABU0B3B4_9FIRM|nr:DRTGG domain-containing protein [Desulfofundulus luciae]MDQ0287210.1 hypothetical protein [Desulfofundulus luciae]